MIPKILASMFLAFVIVVLDIRTEEDVMENLKVGMVAPNFALMGNDGRKYELSRHLGKKNVVLAFYPKDFTFICPTEIIEFSSINDEVESSNAILLGGSTDNEFCKLAWRREHPGLKDLNHYSFADPKGVLSEELGITDTEGYYFNSVEEGSGANISGIKSNLLGQSLSL